MVTCPCKVVKFRLLMVWIRLVVGWGCRMRVIVAIGSVDFVGGGV